MRFWGNLVGYQLVWFCAVIGAGRGLAWPGVVAALMFAAWQLAISTRRGVDLRLIAAAVPLGLLVDGGLGASGLATYAAAWPSAALAPAWILAMWIAFALTLEHSLRFLQGRWWLAAGVGALGGPLAYASAQGGWQAVHLAAPTWPALLYLAVAWGAALVVLAHLAQRWGRGSAAHARPSKQEQEVMR